MKITATPLVCLALVATGCQATEPDHLRVLSYNIHHGEGTDGVFDLERLARVIRSADPDLVALQEVDRGTRRASGVDQAAELGRLTSMKDFFGKALDFSGGEYGEAVLSRLPVLSVTNHPLPFSPGHESRAALEIGVELRNGSHCHFIGTHLDHTREPDDREAQARALNQLFATDDALRLLVGDLNAEPSARSMEILLEHWARAGADLDRPTFPSDAPERTIDYVLMRPAGAWEVESVEVLDEPVASDHAPLLVVLRRFEGR
jgi:endonuclease/exonuclease/phosphatase family metal-dependent hydrolase